MPKLLIVLLLALLPLHAVGAVMVEPAHHVSLPVSDLVKVVAFDHKGYLWIGTSGGLLRYDGYNFSLYRNTMENQSMLSNNNIESIAADGHGRLWIGTSNGITLMDLQTNRTRIYHTPTARQKIVYFVYVDHDGRVWASTEGGLLSYDSRQDRFSSVKGTENLSVKGIVGDAKGHIFFGTWNDGLWMLSKADAKLRRIDIGCSNVFCLQTDRWGRVWAGSWNAGLRLVANPTAAKPQVRLFATGGAEPIYNIITTPDGGAVASSRSVIYTVDRHLNMTTERDHSDDMNAFVATNGRGTLALAKKTDGLDFYTSFTSPLRLFAVPSYDDGMLRGGINSLVSRDGRLFWLLSRTSGISTFDADTRHSLHYRSIPSLSSVATDMKMSSTATSLLDRHGNIWIGNSYFGLLRIDPQGRATHFDLTRQPFREHGVWALAEDRQGRLWIGQTENVAVVAPGGRVQNLHLGSYIPDIGKGEVTHLTEDHRGRMWICTRDNGVLLEDDGNTLRAKPMNQQNGLFPATGAISCVEDSRGQMLFITSAGELIKTDGQRVADGRFYSAIADGDGNIWVSAINYLMRLSANSDGSYDMRRFYIPGPGSSLTLQENSVFRLGSMIYFGSVSRIVAVDTRRLGSSHTPQLRLAINGITVDGVAYDELDSTMRQRISPLVPAYTKEIRLPHSVRRLQLSFSNLDFAASDACSYAFSLEGYTKGWTQVEQGQHSATFENLPSGRYTFRLRCTDQNGRWVEMPYTVTVRVLPPWWATWWACIIYLLMAAAAVYGATVWYRQRLRTQNKLQIARVFANLTHELLTPISVVSAFAEAERDHVAKESYGVIHNNLTRLTRLIRQILEADKMSSGKVELRVGEADLRAFLEQECANLRPLARQKSITISFDSPSDDARLRNAWFDTDKLDKIMYNLLSNAIKYTPEGGHVGVKLAIGNGGMATVSVSDNGIGIAKEKMKHLYSRFMDGNYRRMKTMGTGIGLSLTRDLVHLHHGTISCQSQQGIGTTFTIDLPIAREAYAEGEVDGGGRVEAARGLEFVDTAVEAAPTGGEAKEYTILLVEDNADLLNVMAAELGKAYNVLKASDGRQALSVLGKSAVDVVVSDVMMPIMDGLELTRQIKQNDDFAMLPVILLTAKVGWQDRNEGYRVGADDYLAKPFSMESLRLRIDSIIANRERIRRKFMRQEDYNPEKERYSDPDKQFMERCVEVVKANIMEENYDRERFASDLCMSSSSLYKKLRALTGQGVTGFINSIRLKEACRIMRAEPAISINELYVRVGYSSPSYFRRLFKQEFGITPTDFLDRVKNGRG